MVQLIGASVENQLDLVLWQMIRGELLLEQLTPAIRSFYLLGFEEGALSRQAEIDRAHADADRYYGAAYDTRENQLRRIDSAAEKYWQDVMSGRIDLTELPSRKEEAA